MMNSNRHRRTSPQIRQEAVEWFVAFCENETDTQSCEAFLAWLRISPEHVRVYLRISAFWEHASQLSDRTQTDIAALIERARCEENVVPLGESRRSTTAPAVPRRRWLAVAASALVVGITTGTWWYTQSAGTYSTEVGEQRTLTLPDNSTVILNAQSKVRIAYSDHERSLELLRGQALFRVQKDSARPFFVVSDRTRVRAVGTQFDVYRKESGTVVTVVEGRVSITRSAPSPGSGFTTPLGQKRREGEVAEDPVFLAAGEQLIVSDRSIAAPKRSDVSAAIAWTEGKLVFDSTPLGEVVEEFNRYNRTQLVIEDAALKNFHISGVFASTNSASLIAILKQRFDVRVRESEDEIRISAR